MEIPHSPQVADERINALASTLPMPGRMEAAEVIYRDIVAAVVAAMRFKLDAGGVAWNVEDTQIALRDGWTVFLGVWIQTTDLEQSMAQLDGYLAQDPGARALGGEFYLHGWQLERDKRMLAGLGKRRGDPAA